MVSSIVCSLEYVNWEGRNFWVMVVCNKFFLIFLIVFWMMILWLKVKGNEKILFILNNLIWVVLLFVFCFIRLFSGMIV